MSKKSRQGRIVAMQFLYQQDILGGEAYPFSPQSPFLGKKKNFSFAETLIDSFQKNKDTIDSLLDKTLTHWKKERLSPVLRALLQVSLSEMLLPKEKEGESSYPIIISEALKIASFYAEENALGLANGVLDSCRLLLEKEKHLSLHEKK